MNHLIFATDPYFSTVVARLPRVVLSLLIAVLATFVALELARRVSKAADRISARLWVAAGSVALGTGIWSMHFVGMSAAVYPFAAYYDLKMTVLSWVIAVIVAALLLSAAANRGLRTKSLRFYAVACGVGVSLMHYVGVGALIVMPAASYYPIWVVASLACAVTGCAVALSQFFHLSRLSGWLQIKAQSKAAGLFGAALAAMHYLAMASVDFDDHTVCLTTDGLDVAALGGGVAVASIGFLLLMLLIAALERRGEHIASVLSASLQKAEADLQYVTFHDPVTQLPNRLVFEDRLEQALDYCEANRQRLAVLLVEIDDFQTHCHSLSTAERNKVMQDIAARLTGSSGHLGTVASVGNQQFLILVRVLDDPAQAVRIAHQLAAVFKTAFQIGPRACSLAASIGITLFPDDGARHEINRHAGVALDAAKRIGGNSYAFFEDQMDVAAHQTSAMLEDLRGAVRRGELELHYQPKVHANSGRISGAEALLRWHHPQRGLIGPMLFIPIAERFGLIGEIGSWVINDACRQMQAWSSDGIQMRVAINVSAIQLRQHDLAAEITNALARWGVAPHRLTCEITESSAMQDAAATMSIFERLNAAGVQLSIDDFGTGYSSLSSLRQMPVRQLKVDRSFVSDLGNNSDAEAVVAAIIQMAHALRLEVVAEGVETELQRDVLLALGCDKFQGYLYARPMTAEALTAMAVANAPPNAFRASLFAA